jgi:hypothetical protein
MSIRKLILVALSAPVFASASITFNIINKVNSTHEAHLVRTPIKIIYMENNSEVFFTGSDYIHSGLFSGEQRSENWTGGWTFSSNAGGNYKFLIGCNVDGRTYIEPAGPTIRHLENRSTVNVSVDCQVGKEGFPVTPTVTVDANTNAEPT